MPSDSIRLLDVEPDLARFLAPEERALVEQLRVPVAVIERGPFEMAARLGEERAFGAVVLEGMLLQRIQVGNHLTMKLMGPGDLLARFRSSGSMIVTASSMSAAHDTRVAVLGIEFLGAVRRWPALWAGVHARMGEQAERFAVQLAICQLPRVEERLLALMWWLAEAWGRVTSVGTIVPLAMTHDVLGALIGARRPTVTLALGELAERGAIVRHDRGWLLLEPPPEPSRPADPIDDPSVILPRRDVWRVDDVPVTNEHHRTVLLETVSRLREEHTRRAEEVSQRLAKMRESREAFATRRLQSPVKPPPAQSS